MKKSVIRQAYPLVLAVVLAATAVTGAAADVVTINPAKDNSLYEQDSAASNGAGQFLFSGETNFAQARRALLAFDIAGNVPAGATIDSVTLTMNVSRTAPTGSPSTFSLHAVLADWGEGTSDAGDPGGLGAPATPGDATWTDRFFPTDQWTTPGGDFSGTSSADTTVDGLGFYTWTGAGLVGDVQGWLDTPASNFGWILIGPEDTQQGQARQFDSRENVNPAVQPALEIVFTPDGGEPPDGVPTVSEWGLILMLLLFLSAGTVMFSRARQATMRSGNSALMSATPPLIDVPLFLRALALVFGLLLTGFAAASVVAGVPTGVDLVGSLLCAPVLAYLLHLWFGFRRS